MYGGNPAYSTYPTTPPGIEAIPYMVNSFVAPYTGGIAHPYVSPNQSVHDAWMAKYVNDPMYKAMMSRVYGQMGGQIAATAQALPFVQSIQGMTGYSPAQMHSDMSSLGRSWVGSVMMPLLDYGLNAVGLTGGSITSSANEVFRNRMLLTAPGSYINPYNRDQTVSAMSGASAMMNFVNGLLSQQNADGSLTLLPDTTVTQGFDRARLTKLAMRMAGTGNLGGILADGTRGGFSDVLREANGGFAIDDFDFASGDFTGGGKNSLFAEGSERARKIQKIATQFKDRFSAGVEAMGAMRDFLKEIDGLEDKLDEVTNGEWLRSGSSALSARNSLRKLNAVTLMYDRDPKEAWNDLMMNRGAMQAASGFDAATQSMGFSGGGMFGLAAQTEFLSSVEDMITSRNLRGDPMRANAIRNQARYAMSHNMNTSAGIAAQLLAWGRQNGMLTEDQASELRTGLVSGDRGLITDTINRMLTLEFGSAKRGRELMQDSVFINSMRQSIADSPESGGYAMRTMIAGADREFMQRERITAAGRSLSMSRDMLAGAGMSLRQTPVGIEKAVQSVMMTLHNTPGVDGEDQMFKSMYESMLGKGMKPNEALQATVDAFKSNPGTRRLSERIELALMRQYTENNEYYLRNQGGREGTQAKAMADYMYENRFIDGKQYAEISKMLGDNRGKDALMSLERINGGLSGDLQTMNNFVRDRAGKDFDTAMEATKYSRRANQLLSAAGERGYGSAELAKTISQSVDAAIRYSKTSGAKHDDNDLYQALDNAGLLAAMGPEEYDAFVKGIKSKNKDEVQKTISDMGKMVVHLKQFSTDNVKDNGYGLPIEGYWGGGLYSGNSQIAYMRQQSTVRGLAESIQTSSIKNAKDRQTLAQNFYGAMANKDWRQILSIYDSDNKLRDAGSEYFKLFEDYAKSREAFDGGATEIRNVIRGLSHDGKSVQADLLRKYVDDLDKYTDEDIEKVLSSGGIKGDARDKVMATVAKKREMEALQKKAEEKLKEYGKDEKFIEQAKVFSDKIERDRVHNGRRLNEALPNVDRVDAELIPETRPESFSWYEFWKSEDKRGMALYDAYQAVNDIISDEDLANSKGVKSLDSYRAVDIREGKIALAKQKALQGDEKAIAAMEKFNVASNQGVTRIRGEITLKDGNNQSPALLECVSEVRP